MKILILNDDGYKAGGIHALVKAMLPYGEITVVAPKRHQSGMSMAVSLGLRPIAVKDLGKDEDGVRWIYVDGTPASAAKYAIDKVFGDEKPDVALSGINHGLNSSTASWYSGTMGAARECAVNGIQAIAVSLDDLSREADFSTVQALFPKVFETIMANLKPGAEVIYNVNFPNLKPDEIKGVKVCTLGLEKWVEEFMAWNPDIYEHMGVTPADMGIDALPEPEPGETFYMMAGNVQPDPRNDEYSDNWAVEHGYIAITPHSTDNTDLSEFNRLRKLI